MLSRTAFLKVWLVQFELDYLDLGFIITLSYFFR